MTHIDSFIAEAIFVQGTKWQRYYKNILCVVLVFNLKALVEYHHARVLLILYILRIILNNLAASIESVQTCLDPSSCFQAKKHSLSLQGVWVSFGHPNLKNHP